MKKLLYHISHIENLESIKKNGLLVNDDSMLFLLDDVDFIDPIFKVSNKVSDIVAWNQLFLKDFLLIGVEVDDSILHSDDVAELTRDYQYYIKSNIDSSCIKSIDIRSCENYLKRMKELYDSLELEEK